MSTQVLDDVFGYQQGSQRQIKRKLRRNEKSQEKNREYEKVFFAMPCLRQVLHMKGLYNSKQPNSFVDEDENQHVLIFPLEDWKLKLPWLFNVMSSSTYNPGTDQFFFSILHKDSNRQAFHSNDHQIIQWTNNEATYQGTIIYTQIRKDRMVGAVLVRDLHVV